MSQEKNMALIKKLVKPLAILILGFVCGWSAFGIKSLHTTHYHITVTDNKTGERRAVPLYGTGWAASSDSNGWETSSENAVKGARHDR